MQLTILQYTSNVMAHQQAGYSNGKVQFKGKAYTFSEFDAAFPINAEKLITQDEFNRMKGVNPDTTKV